MHSRRALLYVPGDDARKIEKALGFGVDCICLDLEDGVATNRKALARTNVSKALQDLKFGSSEKLVRINPVGSGLEMGDLEAILPARPDGIVIPKVEEAKQIEMVSRAVEMAELENDWPLKSIRLLISVETGKAILNLRELAKHPRLDAIIFGGEDYAASVGATRTKKATELTYGRQATIAAASANGLQAIDIVHADLADSDTLVRQSVSGAGLGFSGKQVIHPSQVEPVQTAYTPSEESIALAKRVVSGAETNAKLGRGVFVLDEKMIDAPIIKNARKTLERAKAAGKA